MFKRLLNPSTRAGISSGAASPMMISNDEDEENPPHLDLAAHPSYGLDVPGIVTKRLPKTAEDFHITSKLCVIMVGLPARGKSYIVKKLRRYLIWLQYDTQVFNVGNRRRQTAQVSAANTGTKVDHSFNFFDPRNSESSKLRDELALESLEELITYLKNGGRVGIHDATNSSLARRKILRERLEQEPNITVLFIESICNDKRTLEKNMRLKLSGPDYRDKDPDEALRDFKKRVENYEKAYQTIEDSEEVQYCKLIDVGKKIISYNISGFLSGQVIFYMHNFNLAERQVFVTRHGESNDNIVGKIGGDAPLSSLGKKFSAALARFITSQRKLFRHEMEKQRRHSIVEFEKFEAANKKMDSPSLTANNNNKSGPSSRASSVDSSSSDIPLPGGFSVWTSILKRTIQTVEGFDPSLYDIKHIKLLNEICAGLYESLTYEEIEQKHPEEFKAREQNKLFYRYPGMGGESYVDVIHRLQPLIIELERMTESCLIVTHRVVMRILLGYFLGYDHHKLTHMIVPLHTVYELRPKAYGTELKKWRYLEAEDSFIEV